MSSSWTTVLWKSISIFFIKNYRLLARHQWLMTVILAIQEAEIRRMVVRSHQAK
jgi:hypothetical protein